MAETDSTCWTVLREAAAGSRKSREEFARRYQPLIRAYLSARWKASPHLQDLDDAVQEVFVECLRPGGVLAQADPGRPGGFRAFLYGVLRNVARRVETAKRREEGRSPRAGALLEEPAGREESLSKLFDRQWAKLLVQEAADVHRARARRRGERAQRRVKLLRLRFHDGLPIREIARRWKCEALELHREYAEARKDFKQALIDVLRFHHPVSPHEAEQECRELLALLE
jgi:RNA polymerase sigma-70 factor (ECF subfamily)